MKVLHLLILPVFVWLVPGKATMSLLGLPISGSEINVLADSSEQPVEEDDSAGEDDVIHEIQIFIFASMELPGYNTICAPLPAELPREITVPPPQG